MHEILDNLASLLLWKGWQMEKKRIEKRGHVKKNGDAMVFGFLLMLFSFSLALFPLKGKQWL